MNIIYIGSDDSLLSLYPLQALIQSNHNICALVVDDKSNNEFNVINSGSIQELALTHSIPVIKINNNSSKELSQIKSYQPDVIIVSCYARRLSLSFISLAKYGSFNIHPSLLPQFRGPTPIFWQYKHGVSDFGVSLHRMTSKFDRGNIVYQKEIQVEDGVSRHVVTKSLAIIASDFVMALLNDIENNTLTEKPQNNKLSSYQSFPEKKDYEVSTSWTAKRMYNFIHAYKGIGISFLCEVDYKLFCLVDAFSYQENEYENMKDKMLLVENDDSVKFRCNNSYIHCENIAG